MAEAAPAKDSSSFKKLVKAQNLSQCCEEYLLAMADPIGADTGCLPASLVSVPSRKIKVHASGSLGTSTANGNGFILVRPGMLAFNDNVSATVGAIRYTTGTFAGSTFDTSTATAGVQGAQTNSEYQTSQVAAGSVTGIQYRLVSCAIEIEATTPWSTRGGLVNGICEPDHRGLGNANEAQIATLDATFREAVSSGGDSKFQVKYNGPADPSDLDYQSSATGSEAINGPFMGIWLSGPVSQTYLWRVVAHFEIIGAAARGKTVTWPDPQGAGLTQAIMSKTHAENGANHHDSPSFWGTLSNALHQGIKATASGIDKISGMAKSAAGLIEHLPGPDVLMRGGKMALQMYTGSTAKPRIAASPSSSVPRIASRSVPAIAARSKAVKPSTRRTIAARK